MCILLNVLTKSIVSEHNFFLFLINFNIKSIIILSVGLTLSFVCIIRPVLNTVIFTSAVKRLGLLAIKKNKHKCKFQHGLNMYTYRPHQPTHLFHNAFFVNKIKNIEICETLY